MQLRSIFIGLLLGYGIFGIYHNFYVDSLLGRFLDWILFLSLSILFIVIAGMVVYPFLRNALKKRLNLAKEATVSDVSDGLVDLISSIRSGSAEDLSQRSRHFVSTIVYWFTTTQYLRFVLTSSIAVVVAFGGMVGTALLYKQNELIKRQNTLVQQQFKVALLQGHQQEATRRVAVYSLLSRAQTLVSSVPSVIFSTDKRKQEETETTRRGKVSNIKPEVAATSKLFPPYWYVDTNDSRNRAPIDLASLISSDKSDQSLRQLTKGRYVFLSYERGLLLADIIRHAPEMLQDPYFDANFAYADMRGKKFADHDVGGNEPDCKQGIDSDFFTTIRLDRLARKADFTDTSFRWVSLHLGELPLSSRWTGSQIDRSELHFSLTEKRSTRVDLDLTKLSLSDVTFIVLAVSPPALSTPFKITIDMKNVEPGSCFVLKPRSDNTPAEKYPTSAELVDFFKRSISLSAKEFTSNFDITVKESDVYVVKKIPPKRLDEKK